MVKLTKSQSYSNMLRDIEVSLEKDIADYLDSMTEDDRDKVVKASKDHIFHTHNQKNDYTLVGIEKDWGSYQINLKDSVFQLDGWYYPLYQLSLEYKRTLLKLIEETI